MNKVQQQKISTTYEEGNRRRMLNENIATCKSPTGNVQYVKRVQHEKKCNMKRLLHRKVQHGNGAV